MPDPNRFHCQTPHDAENELTIVPIDGPDEWRDRWDKRDLIGGVTISVADEKAVDSYNDTFECDISLTRDTAIELRDWLLNRYPLPK